MSWWLLLAVLAAAGTLMACWRGAGIIMHPPLMTRMEVFPEYFGLAYEKVSFKTKDGLLLKGWFVPSPTGPEEDRTLVMCHGWGDNKGDLLKITHYLNSVAGYNLLYFDNRSHGESEGELTTIGCLETMDFDAAMEYLRREKPWALKRLGVFGLSMGAVVAIMSMPSHPELRAAVLESPFTNFRQVVRQWAWNHFRVPYFPLIIIVLWILRLRVGDPKVDTYHPIAFIGRISPRPLLMVSGSDDALMPEKDVRKLYAVAGEPKQLWIIPGATHAKCHEVAGLEYEARIRRFFDKHL